MHKYFTLITALLLLAGCATYPVTGSIGTKERFVGTAHSVAIGMSKVDLTTESGARCIGEYKASVVMTATSGATSQGTFKCDDGRTGTFAVTGSTISGSGFGKMNNGDKIKIYYGHTSNIQNL